MTVTSRAPLVIRNPRDAIAAVPYLLGFHPSESMVVIAFDGPHNTCALRQDLPPAGEPDGARLAAILKANGFQRALILGYGPADRVAAITAPTHQALTTHGIEVAEVMRVADGRWWSLTCTDEECCPPTGTAYDSAATSIAAQATFAGHVALPDRADLVRSVAPTGLPRREATTRAEQRLFNWAREGLSPARINARIAEEGIAHLDTLLTRARAGGALPDDDEIAWLGVLLNYIRVRDEAWIRINEDDPASDITFWRHVLRRTEEPYVTAPACLLAFAAYTAGDGSLANVALDRADPTYTMGRLLREIMAAGIPPSKARIRITPAQLAAAYTDPPEQEAKAS